MQNQRIENDDSARRLVCRAATFLTWLGLGTVLAHAACQDDPVAPPPPAVASTFAAAVGTNPDRDVLEALYHATGGQTWTDNANWLTDKPLGDWYGVTADSGGRVTGLYLRGNALSGPIPPELGSLASLQVLSLSSNALDGPIPPELGSLASLQVLSLSSNALDGPIPPELGNLASLKWLSLEWNALDGPIPPELGDLASLERLSLGINDLSGPVPPELGNLASLERLSLSSNALSGPIPPELGNLASLEELYLGGNDLSGPVPPELGNLASLERLSLSSNALSGPIPPELGNLASLEWLSLGGNALDGPIPPELGNLASLRVLSLSSNALDGPIPPELGNLASLERLSLGINDLSGPVPPELGNLASLRVLSLSSNALDGPIPPELGNLASLQYMSLGINDLSGPVPPELGNLASLRSLALSNNTLDGPVPGSWGNLAALEQLYLGNNAGLCVPGTERFGIFVASLEHSSVSWCNEADAAVLEALYASAGGEGWENEAGWLDGTVLADWHGVTADSLGRVTALDLADNGLAGVLPAGLGELARLRELRLGRNPLLSGRLPAALSRLSLDVLDYAGTTLCAPAEAAFRAWLAGIGTHAGTTDCAPFTDRDALEALYNATAGHSWVDNTNWLTDKPLGDWHGVRTDSHGRVMWLYLRGNALDGLIPPELGSLASLRVLSLSGALDGPIPPELGDLASLQVLSLSNNTLDGPIPPELGNLASLAVLSLSNNTLDGPIPPELGNLASLEELWLHGNALDGPIPPELGNLASLAVLSLSNNTLDGPIPPELGNLASLEEWILTHNAALEGALPAALTGLHALDIFNADGTGLCAPSDPVFLEWLGEVQNSRVRKCAGAVAAYMTQAVQSRDFPVPLVAGEEALLRVFITASDPGGATLPPVRGRFYLDGAEVRVAEIPATPHPIPEEVDEGTLAASANAKLPGDFVRPGLELVIEVDPEGTLDPALGVAKRIPAEGRLAVDVREMPVFDLTVIPFLWSEDPDSAIIALVEGMSADPQNHELLRQTADLLPVGGWSVTAHAPVLTSSNSGYSVLSETSVIRVMEGGTGHYMGMLPWFSDAGGKAYLGFKASVSVPYSAIIAHELGHNFSLSHAPCGGPADMDPIFPTRHGRIAAWGYAVRQLVNWSYRWGSGRGFAAGGMVPPSIPDVMSYCRNPEWISEYHFTKALEYRIRDEGPATAAMAAAPVRSLLLWGGVDSTGTPSLEPAFVVDAPPSLPERGGEWSIKGRDADGTVLFALPFAMPPVADAGEGAGGFAFALPVRPGWEALAGLTLTGPDETATLDASTDRPMSVWRDGNGQVRAVLRGPPVQADGAQPGGLAGFRVIVSRGIPAPEAWRR